MKLQRRWGFSLLRPRDESKSIVGKTSPLERINLPFENKLLICKTFSFLLGDLRICLQPKIIFCEDLPPGYQSAVTNQTKKPVLVEWK